ncbi:MerR family transcriptional regulator [Gymnodinialimonas ceratoperidinii]|uniref:MerR family transcriptional regulator n=1 Tax=Gymnodinialimonas ceratoperidinii TaxID=2856823 RepID=A0A8F6TW52_9RHOB|nr:MerR family transcriptional regulator [Gymnodinialimonas ceratoperidinii]QXT38791.1 MerR family transcriptional regulator [Gymnodinialimonas ceratoperidinii]
MAKSAQAFRTIREVADWLDVAAHVLRFWESKFPQIKPVKRAGGRRYYRPADMELVGGIKVLLHDRGLTIRGVQKMISDEGIGAVTALSPSIDSFADSADVIEMEPTAAWEDDAKAEARDEPADAAEPSGEPEQPSPEERSETEEASAATKAEEAAEGVPSDAKTPEATAPEAPARDEPATEEAAPDVANTPSEPPESAPESAPSPKRVSSDPAEGPLGTLVALSQLPAAQRRALTGEIAALARLRDRISQHSRAG